MAKLNIVCESCGAEREVDEKLAGSMLPCANCEATIRVPIPNIHAGVTLGGFVLEKQLGFGAMGEVWLARQTAMDRQVALKLLSREYTLDSSFIDRFLKEVRISAKMDHPNIITAFDAGCDNDIHYLAITYVDGETLEDKFEREGALPEKEALKLTFEIAEALCYAWNDFKIIHRDIKPANIMIDRKETAKLMDMGISKTANEGAGLTMTGTIIGTPYYMSPEQGTGDKELDFHSDIYSLGATLYHIVTGELPFDATTALGIVSKHITEPLPSPLDKNPNISEQCSALIETMMAKTQGDRQSSWEEVVSDIKLVLDGKFPVSKPRPSPGESLIMPAAGSRTTSGADIGNEIDSDSMPTNIFNGGVEPPPIQTRDGKQSNKTILGAVAALLFLVVAAAATFLMLSRRNESQTPDETELLASNTQQNEQTNKSAENPDRDSRLPPQARTKVVSSSDAAKANSDERLRRREEMFKFAEEYANEHPESYDIAIKNFKELANVAGGTKYKLMANVQIARLEKSKKTAIAKTLDDLEKQANEYVERKQFAKAAELYRNFDGPLSAETKTVRMRLAVEFDSKTAELAEERKRESEKLESQRKNIIYEIAVKMASGKWNAAASCLKKMKISSKKAKKLLPILNELSNMRKSLTGNLKKQRGKTLLVNTRAGTKRLKVAKVKGKYFYHKEKKRTVVILRKHSISELPASECSRIAGLSAPASLAYSVSESMKSGDFSNAWSSLTKSKTSFSSFLKIGVAELMAENVFVNMLRKLRIAKKLEEPRDLVEKITKNPPPRFVLRRRSIAAKLYRRKLGTTVFAKKYGIVLDALEAGSSDAEPNQTVAEQPSNRNRGSAERTIGGLLVNAINKAAGGEAETIDISKFDINSLNSPRGLREALRQVSREYNGSGRFFSRRGKIMGVDLHDSAGINDKSLALLGMTQLKMLNLANTGITDLTPLKKLPLNELIVSNTNIKDVSPLKGLDSLRNLSIAGTKITDISPIKHLKLLMLDVSDTKIKDLRFVSKMPLKGLRLNNCRLRSYTFLRKLRYLNALEPSELWRKIPGKEYNANRPQHFIFDRGTQPPPPDSTRRTHVRGFDD
ncbi:MAG: protein kinase [Kiritimatiellaeota bacterium]|nr:protein kinase [Kiritimatiellota bacterium]